MRDPTIPALGVTNDGIAINITIPSTQALVKDQGYTYNQSGFTYNQAGVFYGGRQNLNQDIIPIFSTASLEKLSLRAMTEFIDMTLVQTDAIIKDQGYTYNQAGLTYNETGVFYGGVQYQSQDILPLELSFTDIYTKQVHTGKQGPGWFMYINLT